MSTPEQLFLATSVFLLACLLGWRCIVFPRSVRTPDLLILFTGSWLGLGPWLRAGLSGWALPAYDANLVMGAYAAIALYLAGLAFGGWICRKRTKGVSIRALFTRARRVSGMKMIFVVACATALRIYTGAKYGIFLNGTGTEEAIKDLPYWLVSALAIGSFLEAGGVAWASVAIYDEEKYKTKYAAVLVLLVEIAVAFIQGRRWMLQLGLMMTYCGMAFGKRYQGWSMFRKMASAVTLAALIVTFPIFLALRDTYYSDQPKSNAVGGLVDAAHRLAADFSWNRSLEESRENMSSRLDYIGPICTIEAAQRGQPLMYGWGTVYSFLFSLPRVFYPHKTVTPKTEISLHYGVMFIDWSNTMVAYGVSDGGLVGAGLIGILLGSIVGFLEWGVMKFMGEADLVAVTVAGNLFALAWNVENDPSGLGNLIKLTLICYILSWLGKPVWSMLRGNLQRGRM